MSTTSIRERRAIKSFGELHVVITAKQGWMPNPALTSVVSALANNFAHAIDKLPRDFNVQHVFTDAGWEAAVTKVSEVKEAHVSMNGPHLEVRVLLDRPVMRVTAPGVDPTDYTATFRCEWNPVQLSRQDVIKNAAAKVRAA